MATAHHFESDEAVICPVKDLVVGDLVRDFYVKDPSYGIVTEVNPTFDSGRGLARVLWDGDRVSTALRFRSSSGKRGDIIRRKRAGED